MRFAWQTTGEELEMSRMLHPENRLRREAVLFDLDGVIVSSEVQKSETHVETVVQLGGTPSKKLIELYIDVIGLSYEETRDRFLACGNIVPTPEIKEAYRGIYRTIYHSKIEDMKLAPGAQQLLKVLSSRGYRMGLVSSAHPDEVTTILKKNQVEHFFQAVVTADSVKNHKPAPETWDDLAKPEYKGLVAVANPNTSGTAYTTLVTILLMKGEAKGWDSLTRLHKNVSQYTKSGSAPGQLAGRGEVAVGIVFLHDAVMYAEEGFPVKPVAPTDGTGYEIGGLSLIKGAPHKEIAKKFIDWALTPETQAIAKDFRSFQLQSNKKTPLPPVVLKHGMDFEHVKTIKYDFLWASQNRERILKQWTEQVFSQAR